MPRRNPPRQNVPSGKSPLFAQNCDHKKRYTSEAEAEQIKEHQELLTMGLELRVYRCPIPGCGGYHLTRVKE
ncbi:hypothetical protein CYG49_02065 [Candidatus Saccharibacteria bacterium]|nr:MAG: hypothetical protein CYG49_02065 [Candidatus Saccharibacteria bacterium]